MKRKVIHDHTPTKAHLKTLQWIKKSNFTLRKSPCTYLWGFYYVSIILHTSSQVTVSTTPRSKYWYKVLLQSENSGSGRLNHWPRVAQLLEAQAEFDPSLPNCKASILSTLSHHLQLSHMAGSDKRSESDLKKLLAERMEPRVVLTVTTVVVVTEFCGQAASGNLH